MRHSTVHASFKGMFPFSFVCCLRTGFRHSASPLIALKPSKEFVWGQQPTSAATEQTRWAKDLELRPSNTPSDVLRLRPGLTIGQHHGGGKGDQILFRGFDSDHGTDFAVFIDGIPVNIVSHAHGQGYTDLHWRIPETIGRVEIYKGPYFAHLGNFATSGAMSIIRKEQAARPQVISPPIEQAVKPPESHTPLPVDTMPQNSTAPAEVDGSADTLSGKGESGVIAGPGTGEGGGTASLGSGRGPGTPGDAAPNTPVRINREAKPVQTVRATYPPMALPMGLEGDVTLSISIDSEGSVIHAGIIKSGGAGFDDEALKAVKQARFEPAQNEGRTVPAVLTYVYRFRLRK